MRSLQEQYNLIKKRKGSKYIFLQEAKKQFPNYLTNPMGFNEVSKILQNKGIINENIIHPQVIMGFEEKKDENWESSFKNFLKEEKKEESIKVENTKTDKSVEDIQNNSYDNKDIKNLDNQIGNEVFRGIYFELKETPDKTLDEIRTIVSKNLSKDPIYYTKNAMFAIKDVGYETEIPGLGTPKEPKGPHKSSGYGNLNESQTEATKFYKSLKVGDKAIYNSIEKNGIKKGDEVRVDSIISNSTFDKIITIKKDNKKVIIKNHSGLKPISNQNLNKNINESLKSQYIISKTGSKSNPYFVIEKENGSEQIDMMFDTYKDAEKYAEKKRWVTKKGLNINEENDDVLFNNFAKLQWDRSNSEYQLKWGNNFNKYKEALKNQKNNNPTWIKYKSKYQVNESSNLDLTKPYSVVEKGGLIGSNKSNYVPGKGRIVATFDNVEEAKEYAKMRRKFLSPGEKSYYGMGYLLIKTPKNLNESNSPYKIMFGSGKLEDRAKEFVGINESNDFGGMGLLVYGRTQEDNQLIDQVMEEEGLYGIFNAYENYWFFPEEEETIDSLENQLEDAFIKKGINARFEGQFNESIKEGIHDMDIISAPHTRAGLRHDLTSQRDTITNSPYIYKIRPILKKYNLKLEDWIKMAEVDQLTKKELWDMDYVEDRIETHQSLQEQGSTELERIKKEAKRIADEEGVVQHVEKDGRGGYRISDWYDSDLTVATFGRGTMYENKLNKEYKIKKESLDSRLENIEKQGNIVTLEAKISTIDEEIKSRLERMKIIDENNDLASLIDSKKLKSMQKDIKLLEKRGEKLKKIYEKMCGKSYQQEEILDEDPQEEN